MPLDARTAATCVTDSSLKIVDYCEDGCILDGCILFVYIKA